MAARFSTGGFHRWKAPAKPKPKPPAAKPKAKPTVPGHVSGHVVLWSTDEGQSVALLVDKPAQATGERAGGWRSIPRPQLRPVLTWDGHEQVELTVTGYLDGHGTGRSVQPEIDTLRQLASKVSGTVRRPHVLRVIGSVPVPTDGSDPVYVIGSGLRITEEPRVNGQVVRALVSVPLLQYVTPEVDLRITKQAKATRRIYTWRKGDTLNRVCKRELGDVKRRTQVRKMNPKVKKWSTLEPGKSKIVLPPR